MKSLKIKVKFLHSEDMIFSNVKGCAYNHETRVFLVEFTSGNCVFIPAENVLCIGPVNDDLIFG